MPSTRGNNAPRRSRRVTDNEKAAAKRKAQDDAKAATKAKASAAAAAKKKAATKPKTEDKENATTAQLKKGATKAAKTVKSEVVKPAAKKVAAATGASATTKKGKASTSTKAAAPAKKTAAAAPKKKTSSSSTKAATKPKAAPAKRGPPKARGDAGDDKAKKEDGEVAHYKVGDEVDDITLQTGKLFVCFFEDDEPVSLKSLFEDKHLVIFSYPKVRRRTSVSDLSHIADDAMFCLARSEAALTLRVSRTCLQADTPGCTTQACGYRDVRSEYEEHGATVIGLSTDKPTAQLKWKSKHELGYSLLSDPKHTLLSKLGWSEKNKRCHWVIEKGGKLAEAKLGVKPADDPKNALEFVKSLKA
ncbi:nuclear thiol peroxidase [Rhodotorula taiwanensis]|uniref:Nuclear thiol peroxidase n=1 Tax=Rhodotorula taiwanensis TaxID=741276 RepID=A0A2S5BEB2_9BASI|nr:nuclear thiol peroxidase [Rhodotorula taiwanensis]